MTTIRKIWRCREIQDAEFAKMTESRFDKMRSPWRVRRIIVAVHKILQHWGDSRLHSKYIRSSVWTAFVLRRRARRKTCVPSRDQRRTKTPFVSPERPYSSNCSANQGRMTLPKRLHNGILLSGIVQRPPSSGSQIHLDTMTFFILHLSWSNIEPGTFETANFLAGEAAERCFSSSLNVICKYCGGVFRVRAACHRYLRKW